MNPAHLLGGPTCRICHQPLAALFCVSIGAITGTSLAQDDAHEIAPARGNGDMEGALGHLKRNEARILITYFQREEQRERERERTRRMDSLIEIRLRNRPGQSQMPRFHKRPQSRSSLAFSLSLSLLSVIYNINDIIKACPDECNVKMLADDTLIYVSGDGSEEPERKMNMIE